MAQVERPRHVAFKVRLAPVDPFSDQNAVSTDNKIDIRRGETFLVVLEGAPKKVGTPTRLPSTPKAQTTAQLSQVRLSDGKDFVTLWPIAESEPELKPEEGNPGLIYEYERPFTWTMEVLARAEAASGPHNLEITLRLQVCDPKGCLTEKQTLTVPVNISTAAAAPLASDVQKLLKDFDEAQANGRRQPAGGADQREGGPTSRLTPAVRQNLMTWDKSRSSTALRWSASPETDRPACGPPFSPPSWAASFRS